MQYYAGISGESIDFPNNAAAEIDFYGGIRPTFDKLALDFGFWYYWYPGGNCYGIPSFADGFWIPTNAQCGANSAGLAVPSKNTNPAYLHRQRREGERRASTSCMPRPPTQLTISGRPASRNGTRRRLSNTGATGWYTVGNVTYTAPSTWFPANSGLGGYISG